MRVIFFSSITLLCLAAYIFIISSSEDNTFKPSAVSNSEYDEKVSEYQAVTTAEKSHDQIYEGNIVDIKAEPGSFYFSVLDSSGAEKVLRTASIHNAFLFEKPEINQTIRWKVLSEDDNYVSKHLDINQGHIFHVVLLPILPVSGTVQNINVLPNETVISVKIENEKDDTYFASLKLKNAEKETIQKLEEGITITWDEAKLLSVRNIPSKTAVLAIQKFKIKQNN